MAIRKNNIPVKQLPQSLLAPKETEEIIASYEPFNSSFSTQLEEEKEDKGDEQCGSVSRCVCVSSSSSSFCPSSSPSSSSSSRMGMTSDYPRIKINPSLAGFSLLLDPLVSSLHDFDEFLL
jgi:hypothetical protein